MLSVYLYIYIYIYIYIFLGFYGFIFVILANLVNNFIVYFNTAFYFIVTIFRTKDTILCLLNIQTQFVCTQPIVYIFLIRGLALNYQYHNLNDKLLYHQQR